MPARRGGRAGRLGHLALGAGIALASLAVAAAGADLIFRWYERTFLTVEPETGGKEIDLARLGFNETSIARRKPAGEFRVLSFGDSFALGLVAYPATYHAVAADLAGKATGRKVRIVSLGEGGTTFQHYIRAYQYWSKRIEHDAVIFNTFMGNDLPEAESLPPMGTLTSERVTTPEEGAPPELRKPLAVVPRRFPLRMLDYFHAYVMTARHPGMTPGAGETRDLSGRGPETAEMVYEIEKAMAVTYSPAETGKLAQGYAQFVRLVRLMSEIRAGGKGVLLVLSPSRYQVSPSPMKRLSLDRKGLDFGLPVFLAQAAVRKVDPGIPVLNLVTAFRCESERGLDFYIPADSHWNAAGNRLAGERIAVFIEKEWMGYSQKPGGGPCDDMRILGAIEGKTPARMAAARELLSPLLTGTGGYRTYVGTPYARLVGKDIKELEAGGRIAAIVVSDSGNKGGSTVSGRITGLPKTADGVVLGISSNGVMEAVVRVQRTNPGECRFSARLGGGGDGDRLLEYHVISPEEGALRLQLYQTASMKLDEWALTRDARSGAEIMTGKDGRQIQVIPGLVNGMVERSINEGEFIEMEGIAALAGQRPRRAEDILVFANGRLIYRAWTGRDRAGLEKALGVPRASFRFRISKKFTDDPAASGIRVFAEVAPGTISELRYHSGYAWGKPVIGQSLFYTDDLKEILTNPAANDGQ